MIKYRDRTYRKHIKIKDLISFQVIVKETDLWISADKNLEEEARDFVFNCRNTIETYIRSYPAFMSALSSYPEDPYAPIIIRNMIQYSRLVKVGPMASVAGAIAQYVCEGLLDLTEQAIVENGGDIFLKTDRRTTISVFAGDSPLSEKIGLVIRPEQMPIGVCTSSGTVGHSLSGGSSDAVCIISPSALLADAAATALGNRLSEKKDMDAAVKWAKSVEGIMGGLLIMGDRMTAWGEIELAEL